MVTTTFTFKTAIGGYISKICQNGGAWSTGDSELHAKYGIGPVMPSMKMTPAKDEEVREYRVITFNGTTFLVNSLEGVQFMRQLNAQVA